jgi:hypothetical protein
VSLLNSNFSTHLKSTFVIPLSNNWIINRYFFFSFLNNFIYFFKYKCLS